MKEGKTEKIVGINHQTFRQKRHPISGIPARWLC